MPLDEPAAPLEAANTQGRGLAGTEALASNALSSPEDFYERMPPPRRPPSDPQVSFSSDLAQGDSNASTAALLRATTALQLSADAGLAPNPHRPEDFDDGMPPPRRPLPWQPPNLANGAAPSDTDVAFAPNPRSPEDFDDGLPPPHRPLPRQLPNAAATDKRSFASAWQHGDPDPEAAGPTGGEDNESGASQSQWGEWYAIVGYCLVAALLSAFLTARVLHCACRHRGRVEFRETGKSAPHPQYLQDLAVIGVAVNMAQGPIVGVLSSPNLESLQGPLPGVLPGVVPAVGITSVCGLRLLIDVCTLLPVDYIAILR